MKNKIDYLKNSPVYAMSLGSKELFHSNFWAWLMEMDESFIDIFFKNEGEKMLCGIGREDGHRDITVYRKNNKDDKKEKDDVYVVENKLKSIPTAKQLEEYRDSVGKWGNWKGGILTGVRKPLFDLPRGWSFMSHREIAEKISIAARHSSAEDIKNNIEIIEQYCRVLNDISDILEEKLEATNGIFTYDVDGLDELRLSDIAKKMKAESFLECLRNYLKERETELPQVHNDFCLKTEVGFHNGKATIDVRYSDWKDDKTKKWLSIGVQIEEYQYRRLAERDKKGHTLDGIYDEFKSKEIGWFDDEYDKRNKKMIFNQPTTMKPRGNKKYNKYEGDTYNFVYQYYDLHKDTAYPEICQRIFCDLKKVLGYLRSVEV